MPRRPGGDKLHNKRKLDRKNDTKSTVPDIIIACEDSKSSPAYFKKIVDNLRDNRIITSDSFVIVKHKHTNPVGVLEDLIAYSDVNGKKYKDFDNKWIVIDRDKGGHTPKDFNEALLMAKNSNIEVAYSNDSFELWYLLHFNYINTPMTRVDILSKLIILLKELDPKEFSKLNKVNIKNEKYTNIIFDTLLDKQQKAITKATKLLKSYNPNHNPEKDNPSTTVHLLVEVLNKLHISK